MTADPGGPRDRHALEAAISESGLFDEVVVIDADGERVAVVVPNMSLLRDGHTGRPRDRIRIAVRLAAGDARLDRVIISTRPLMRTPAGIIDRSRIGAHLAAHGDVSAAERYDGSEDIFRDPRVAALWSLLEQRYALQHLTPDLSPQLDLGLDSIEWINLIAAIEEKCGARLEETAVRRIATLADLVAEITNADRGVGARSAAQCFCDPEHALSADELRWLAPTSPTLRALGALLFVLNRLIFRWFFRVEVRGLDHLPLSGPYVVAVNHLSDLDHFVVAAALPWRIMRRLHWAGDEGRLFATPLRRFLSRVCGVHPASDHVARATIARGCLLLRQGRIHCWFPEGWRSPDGRLQPFARGLGAVLHHTGVPVVPAILKGTFVAMPRTRRWPRRARVRLIFGTPLDPRQLAMRGRGAEPYARIVDALHSTMERIACAGEAGLT